MNLMMITLLTVGSAVGQVPVAGHGSAAVEEYSEDCYDADRRAGISDHLRNKRAIHNTAPQTCYSPRYGCYHSNERHMHRYPAFHGTFYRQAYNYRNYFDYPWHAQPHEPTSLFSYDVGEDQPEPEAPKAPTPQARRLEPAVRPQAAAPTKPAASPATAKAVTAPATAKSPGSSPTVSQSAYKAPASASRRIGSSSTSDVKPASATASTTSRRVTTSATTSR